MGTPWTGAPGRPDRLSLYTLPWRAGTPPRQGSRPRSSQEVTIIFTNDPDRDWERYGAEDPYYAILNTEAYRRDRLDDAAIEEIFRSGENCVEGFLAQAGRCFGWQHRGSALEFGCGVGRLLLPLARRFDSATGVDVSKSMLAEAERHRRLAGADNVHLEISDDGLTGLDACYDFILSYLVFQHLPVPRGEAVLRRLLDLLRPGGVAALHFTTRRTGSPLRQMVHVLRRNFLPLHRVANLVSGMRFDEPLMQTNLYSLPRLRHIVAAQGITEVEEVPVQHGDHVGVMLYLKRAQKLPPSAIPGHARPTSLR